MPASKRFLSLLLTAITAGIFTACHIEDPGPIQSYEKTFSQFDFDRLEIGSAFDIRVAQGSDFAVSALGDRRNIDDLLVYSNGSTLVVRYEHTAQRNHQTILTITMPVLAGAHFSDAATASISGFESESVLDVRLSGAATCQMDADFAQITAVLSAASRLRLLGSGDRLQAELSGASELSASEYPVGEADVILTGASHGRVSVANHLTAVATGASSLVYRGSPSVVANVSGASTVRQE